MISYIVEQLPFGLNVSDLLVHLDPFNSNTITFSSCVTILSQIITDQSTKSTLLLDLPQTSPSIYY